MSKRQDKNFPKSDPERHKIPSFPASSSKPKVTVIIDVNANKRQGKVGEDCAKRPGSESLRKKEAVYFEYFKNRPLEGGTYEKDTIYGKIDIGTPMESRTWTSYYPYSSAASDSKAKSQATYPVQTLTEKIEKTGKPQNPQNPTHIQKGPSNFRYEPPNLSFVRADSFFQKITGRPTEGDPDPRTRDLKKLISQNPWEKSLSTDEKGLPLSDAECERNVRARFEAMEKDFAKFRDRKEPRITDPVPPKPEKYEKLNPIADKDPFLYAKEQRLEDERKTQERVNSMLSDINLKFERPFFPHKVEPVKNLVQENKPEGKETDFGEKVLRALEGLRKEDPRKASGLDTYAKEKGFGALVGSVADYMEETREPFPFRDIIKARKAYGRESLWNASAGDVSFALLKIAERLSPAAKGLGIIGGVLSAKEGLEILDKSNKLLEEKSGLDPKSSIRINALSECDDPYTAKFLSDSFSTQAEKAKLERASSIFKYMEEDPNANRPKIFSTPRGEPRKLEVPEETGVVENWRKLTIPKGFVIPEYESGLVETFPVRELDWRELILYNEKAKEGLAGATVVSLRDGYGKTAEEREKIFGEIKDILKELHPEADEEKLSSLAKEIEPKISRTHKGEGICGKEQKTKTEGHEEAVEVLTEAMKKGEDAVLILRDLGIKNLFVELLGSNLRPDLVILEKDGSATLIEVRSKSQTKEELENKLKNLKNELKERLDMKEEKVKIEIYDPKEVFEKHPDIEIKKPFGQNSFFDGPLDYYGEESKLAGEEREGDFV